MADEKKSAILALRDAIRLRGVPLKAIAERTGVPYRSLHNYFNGTSEIPLKVYLAICHAAAIPPEWPLYNNRAKLSHEYLRKALIETFGHHMPSLDESMRVIPRSGDKQDDRTIRLDAGTFAVLIESRYDQAALYDLARGAEDDDV